RPRPGRELRLDAASRPVQHSHLVCAFVGNEHDIVRRLGLPGAGDEEESGDGRDAKRRNDAALPDKSRRGIDAPGIFVE
ncbi:MAG: hypothetical protein ACTHOI_10065, partial [Sphingomicrobium sp.]